MERMELRKGERTMEIKLIELRDRGTFVPMVALKFNAHTRQELWLAGRAGFGRTHIDQQCYVLFGPLDCSEAMQYDPYKWRNQRTYGDSHRWLLANWDNLKSGDVIDVEYINGETDTAKISEMGTQ